MTYEMHYFSKKVFLNQIEYGPFRGCSQMEGRGRQKGPNYHPPLPLPPPWRLSNASCNDKIWQSYTVPKGDPKSI